MAIKGTVIARAMPAASRASLTRPGGCSSTSCATGSRRGPPYQPLQSASLMLPTAASRGPLIPSCATMVSSRPSFRTRNAAPMSICSASRVSVRASSSTRSRSSDPLAAAAIAFSVASSRVRSSTRRSSSAYESRSCPDIRLNCVANSSISSPELTSMVRPKLPEATSLAASERSLSGLVRRCTPTKTTSAGSTNPSPRRP